MKAILFFIVLVIMQNTFAQGVTPADWGLESFHITDAKLGDIHIYVTAKGIEEKKPLVFLMYGCRGLPTMLVVESGEKSIQLGTVPPDQIFTFADEYHVAFIGKAGTPFCDTMHVQEINPMQHLEDYQPSEEYIQHCGMEWEIQASSAVLDTLCRMLPLTDKIIAVGGSEGGLLAMRLAASDNRITHLVSIVSTGLNQFYSSIINRRMDAAMGTMTHQEAQAAVDSLFAVYRKIYSDPNSTEKWYYGHPYKRWGSYANYIPLYDLVKLDIPILFVNGTLDRSSPILQADYIQLEFIRLGKDNLTCYVMPGVEHSLYEIVVEDGKERGVSRREEAFTAVTEWIAQN
ncbi:hypothetical protein EH223_10660 [candidate division KSB1 bacterium]|nr:alpha/beta hydrolase [candidate division KSB1 bacterium]RQW03216.1 MAG: hypothetical protein EH223_10660 [candidate division KSB1 bacterium]